MTSPFSKIGRKLQQHRSEDSIPRRIIYGCEGRIYFCDVTVLREFYIHSSLYRHSMLIRSNKMQLTQVFIYCKIILHVSGVNRTHHQEYVKL